jgi:peptidoglycan hydrolase-like protein with peptidoglycan-binding domain
MNNTRPFAYGLLLLALLLVKLHMPEAVAGIRCYARDSFSKNFIIAVQEMLNASGINAGPVDGLWGPNTERGVGAFQRSRGLEVTYDLNGPTLRALFGEGFDPKKYGLVPNPSMPAGIFERHCQ